MHDPKRRAAKIASGALLLLALVWQHVQATRLGYEVERSRRQVQSLKGRLAGLRAELEAASAPARLAERARTRLGMFPASPESLRRLPEAPEARADETLLGRIFPKRRSPASPANT